MPDGITVMRIFSFSFRPPWWGAAAYVATVRGDYKQ